jgi:hypothetical protein
MYILIFALFLVLGLLFWSTIQSAIKTMINSSLQNGYMWFFLLLIINIVVLAILVGYYYYISNKAGKQGLAGNQGIVGQSGNECKFTDSCPTKKI